MKMASEYNLSKHNIHLIEGKWSNVSNLDYETTLWKNFTKNESPPNSFIELELLNERTLVVKLISENVIIDSRLFKVTKRTSWYELSSQHIAHTLFWYIIWGWETRNIYLGITYGENLWVNVVGNGSLMIGFVPVFGGGNDVGTVNIYRRANVIYKYNYK